MPYRAPAGQPDPDIVVRRYRVTIAVRRDDRSLAVYSRTVIADDGAAALSYVIYKLADTVPGNVWSQDVVCAEDLYTTEADVGAYNGEAYEI